MNVDLIKLRSDLTPSVNKPFLNPFGELVYLMPLIIDDKRAGLTDCCSYKNPCYHHIKFKNNDKSSLN